MLPSSDARATICGMSILLMKYFIHGQDARATLSAFVPSGVK